MTNKGEYLKNQLDRAYAAKDAAMSELVSHAVASTSSQEAVPSTSLEEGIRHAAVRVRRTKKAVNKWSDYMEDTVKTIDDNVKRRAKTKQKMKTSAKIRCANKSTSRQERNTLHGDHTYGK